MDKSFMIGVIQGILTANCITAIIQIICTFVSVERRREIMPEDAVQYVLAAVKFVLNMVALACAAALLKMAS